MVMSKIELVEILSKTQHAGQKYGTEDYFTYHVQGVVNSLRLHNLPEIYIKVAFLHDIVEDTNISLSTIIDLFGKDVGEAVDAITKRENETRKEYLLRCASNPISRIVKLHDAMFNGTNCHKNKNKQKFNYYLETISALQIA